MSPRCSCSNCTSSSGPCKDARCMSFQWTPFGLSGSLENSCSILDSGSQVPAERAVTSRWQVGAISMIHEWP